MVIHHQQMEPLLPFLRVHCTDQHTAGIDPHHGARRQVGDSYAGLADQFVRLVILVYAAQDRSVFACSVVQDKL